MTTASEVLMSCPAGKEARNEVADTTEEIIASEIESSLQVDEVRRMHKSSPSYRMSIQSVDMKCFDADDENAPQKKKYECFPSLENLNCNICEGSKIMNFWEDSREVSLQDQLGRSITCTLRAAMERDLEDIENLCGMESERMFGVQNLYHLIESSFLQRALVDDRTNEMVAFISVQDYPNPTFLAETEWEHWMVTKYNIEELTSQNSIFLHFLVWNKKYEAYDFIETLVKAAFSVDPYIEYLLFVLPPNTSLCWPYGRVFCCYSERLDELKSARSGDVLTKDLLLAFRCDCGPTVELIPPRAQLDRETCHLLIEALRKKKTRKKWLKRMFDKSTKRIIITGLCRDNCSLDAGIIIAKKNVDLYELDKHYDTFPFYKFRSSTKHDTWFQILNGKPGLQCLVKKCNSEALKLLIDPKSQKKKERPKVKRLIGLTKKEIAKCRGPHGFNFDHSYTDRRDDDCSDSDEGVQSEIIPNESSSTDLLELYKVVGKNVIVKPKKYENSSLGLGQIPLEGEDESQPKILDYEPADKSFQRVCSDEIPTMKPLNLEFFGECLAIELELYDPPVNQDKSLILHYLKAIFEKINGTYIIFKNKNKIEMNPMLQYFYMAQKQKKQHVPKKSLYVCHKEAICGTFYTKEMTFADFEKIIAASWNIPYRKLIQEDLLNIFLKKKLTAWQRNPSKSFKKFLTLESRAFIFMASDYPVGFAVVKPHHDLEYYKSNYYLEYYMNPNSHSVDGHGEVRHFFLNPLFSQHTRHFLRGVMKICRWTSLIANFSPCRLPQLKGCSMIEELIHWVQVEPRTLPQLAKFVDRRRYSPSLNQAPRSLHLLTYSMSVFMKNLFTVDLVIVGSGDVAISFLEHLLLSRFNANYGFKNLTLIANDGMESSFPEKYSEAVKLMIPWNGRYDQHRLDQCNLENWVQIIKKEMISIDREKRVVEVKGGETFHFDYLFLFCGTQFTCPQTKKEKEKSKSKQNPECRNNLFTAENFKLAKAVNIPKNVFTINSGYEAYKASETIDTVLTLIPQLKDGQYVVYGNCVEVFSCVAGLLQMGIYGRKISLFITQEGRTKSVSCIHSQLVMDAIYKTLKNVEVNIYTGSAFLKWEEITIEEDKYVEHALFKTDSSTIFCRVQAIFSYDMKTVKPNTYQGYYLILAEDLASEDYLASPEKLKSLLHQRYLQYKDYSMKIFKKAERRLPVPKYPVRTGSFPFHLIKLLSGHTVPFACKKSGLWYNYKLLIDSKFRTSDEKIYAGGSLTTYPAIYKTQGYNHEFYNSVEIGAEIAKRFWDKVLSFGKEEEPDEKELLARPVALTRPLVICAQFADNWYYVRIAGPGNAIRAFKDRSLKYKLIQTGNPYDKNGPGLFQLILNEHNIVKDIVCYRKSPIQVKDFINIYGKHESYLNNLLCRIKGGLINNLFDFFNEPWTFFIFDDKFDSFYQKLHLNYFKQRHIFSSEASFYDLVAYLLNLEKWKGLTKDDEHFLEDLFCYNPDLKLNIEKSLINFIGKNEDFLITRLDIENRYKYKSKFSKSRLLNDFRKEMGLQSIMPEPVSHIVPTIEQYRYMDMTTFDNKKKIINSLEMGKPKSKHLFTKKKRQKMGKNYYRQMIEELEPEIELSPSTAEFKKDESLNLNEIKEIDTYEDNSSIINIMDDEFNFNEDIRMNNEHMSNEFGIFDEYNVFEEEKEEDCKIHLLRETLKPEVTFNINFENMKFEKDIERKLELFQKGINQSFPEEKNENTECFRREK